VVVDVVIIVMLVLVLVVMLVVVVMIIVVVMVSVAVAIGVAVAIAVGVAVAMAVSAEVAVPPRVAVSVAVAMAPIGGYGMLISRVVELVVADARPVVRVYVAVAVAQRVAVDVDAAILEAAVGDDGDDGDDGGDAGARVRQDDQEDGALEKVWSFIRVPRGFITLGCVWRGGGGSQPELFIPGSRRFREIPQMIPADYFYDSLSSVESAILDFPWPNSEVGLN
jgi:hypothetical protein